MSYFIEKDEVLCVIEKISSLTSLSDDFSTKFEWLTAIIGKYQEQPLLINSALPELTEPLTKRITSIVHEFHESFVPQLNGLCKVFQLLCRVRGYKHVMKQLPHGVESLELCFNLLQQKKYFQYDNWETKYVLLLWLRMLCLIPFDICAMDSSIAENMQETTPSGSKLVLNIVSMCHECLSDTGPTREASSICLSTLLTRPDMEIQVLGSFLDSCGNALTSWLSKGSAAQSELSSKSFEIIGILQCLGQIFKTGHRNKVLPYAAHLLTSVLELSKQPNQVLIRKLVAKLVQRIGMTFLPPRQLSWQYQRGKRSLATNLSNSEDSSEKLATNLTELEEESELFDIPGEMDDIFEYLLGRLSDKDT